MKTLLAAAAALSLLVGPTLAGDWKPRRDPQMNRDLLIHAAAGFFTYPDLCGPQVSERQQAGFRKYMSLHDFDTRAHEKEIIAAILRINKRLISDPAERAVACTKIKEAITGFEAYARAKGT